MPQHSDTTVDQRREDTTRLHDEVQRNPDGQTMRSAHLRTENRKHSSLIVQKDTEVIHKEVGGGTEINCFLKEYQSEFSGEPVRILGNKNAQKQSRVIRCATLTSPARSFADKSFAKVSRRTDHRGASATADFERDRRNDEAGPT